MTRAKVEFYSLDEVSNILFFSLASVLALFWAELYYISIDRAETFTCIVRPVTYVLNGIAIIGVITLSCIVSKNFSSDVDYVFVQFAILVTITYLIAAIMFTYYAYMSALELEKVPLPMIARRDRLFSLRMLACVTIVALILKASAVLYMNGKSVATDTVVSLFLVFVYFVFCEILPVCIILVFYRVDSWNGESSSGRSDIDSNTGELSTRNARIAPSMRSASGEAQPEVVDAIIARLSLETGTGTVSKERQSGDIDDPMEREGLLGAKGSSRYQNLSL